MVDLIDVDMSIDVNVLFRLFVDLLGSLQEKCRNYVIVNFNGYVGVFVGYELLSGGLLKNNESYVIFVLIILVGIFFSKFFGEGKKVQFYSLFLFILDLGSFMIYFLNGNVVGES